MNKIIISLLFLFFNFLLVNKATAINFGFEELVKPTAEKSGYSAETDETSLAATVGFVIQIVFSFIGVIFLCLMVYAGYMWMTARGDDTKVDKAMDIIKTSIVGLIITLGAYSITSFVVPKLVEKASGKPITNAVPEDSE